LTALQNANWEPPVDIFETDHQVVVWVALPGVDPKELQVVIDGDVIAIKGVRHLPESARDGTIHRLECPYGRFERRLRLPSTRLQLDHSELQAGCLTVSLNKVP
jgi:HSP20 family molecular chaperone IbpA